MVAVVVAAAAVVADDAAAVVAGMIDAVSVSTVVAAAMGIDATGVAGVAVVCGEWRGRVDGGLCLTRHLVS